MTTWSEGETMKRYEIEPYTKNGDAYWEDCEHPEGEWVRWEDVEKLLTCPECGWGLEVQIVAPNAHWLATCAGCKRTHSRIAISPLEALLSYRMEVKP